MILSLILIAVFISIVLVANLIFRFKSKILWVFSVVLIVIIPFSSLKISSKFLGEPIDLKTVDDSIIVVLGAGIRNDTPTDILKRRLETAKEIYDQTKQKIIVTGDNSQQYHNEPRVMKNYLIKLGVPSVDIIEDFGGRRTMDSCYRIKNFFSANKIVLVSQAFHLPRARFLCESVGLSVQTKAASDSNYSTALSGYLREIPASWAGLFDSVYFKPQVGSDGTESIE
jgi:SanA protein